MNSLYNLPTESHQSLNQRAHPGGGVEVAGIESGEGLVEDQYEAHLKGLYVAYREPAAGKIAALAGALEKEGFGELAEQVDEVLAGFYDHGLVKSAATPVLPGLGAALLSMYGLPTYWLYGLYSFFWDHFQSIQEDSADLVQNIENWYDDDEFKNGGVEPNQIAARMLKNAKALESTMLQARKLAEQMEASPEKNSANQLDSAVKAMTDLVKSINDDFAHMRTHYATGSLLDFERTESLIADIVKHKNSIEEMALKVQQKSDQAPSAKTSTQTAPASPAQQAAPIDPHLIRVIGDARNVLNHFAALQHKVNGKRLIPGAKEKIEQLMTPEFLGAIKNVKYNVLPPLESGQLNLRRDHDFIEGSISRAQTQIQRFEEGLAEIR